MNDSLSSLPMDLKILNSLLNEVFSNPRTTDPTKEVLEYSLVSKSWYNYTINYLKNREINNFSNST
ncbi:expressed protein [Dictyostelium purpureum]|uniref:Expressed protein n=1 Tax=Dictyostelium purpureum TaxID=5786 RepID=F0ZHN9_DICPU|nr:uncharacterized protein DICPUDRAFT_91812 [Dictyostelium purpureum]EGC36546.1 expressed protein [Dictyostelium purpureum]|eukprot:XP_003286918.1 expressed protein [Dictyostelium purpureum]